MELVLLACLVIGNGAEDPARRFRWKHNESKEDPIQRRNFKADVIGSCNEELEFLDAMTRGGKKFFDELLSTYLI